MLFLTMHGFNEGWTLIPLSKDEKHMPFKHSILILMKASIEEKWKEINEIYLMIFSMRY
jgi:hypothetical protein